ncbi:CoA transferase subunit A [Heliophilum fasciatum]|uniref:Glutaconate CoA-transferase subunit A n=1 Tax=Heliophilum fasciatum TaxID=35700 RepID=A0A4R2RW80_9FIRM|nr:CoA transferase [Heliophilum fasciatum]MCW2276839.1 glutaconate CoA-transferase subunit A [Heliophilum fasciatum]TCP68700.1 glutaconate CoA-transferase subunit A [Heliophilum fasciatum]
MTQQKRISLKEAAGLIKDGDAITFSGFTIWRRPFAMIYELIRQGRKNLHLMEVNGGTHTDMFAGAGALGIWESCWAGHELYGKLGANVSRRAQAGEMLVEDYSHVHMVCRFAAGSMGLPYYPTYASLGTDILNPAYDTLGNAGLRDGSNPKIPRHKYLHATSDFYEPSHLLHIPAARPDWCIVQAQLVGEEGTIRINGQKYSDEEAIKSAERVIVLAESVVPESALRQEPERNLIPPYFVDYIIEVPWGAHPTGVYGNYEVDGKFINDYYNRTKTQEGFDAWAQEWIYGVESHEEYLAKLGISRLESLRANPMLKYSTNVKRGSRS